MKKILCIVAAISLMVSTVIFPVGAATADLSTESIVHVSSVIDTDGSFELNLNAPQSEEGITYISHIYSNSASRISGSLEIAQVVVNVYSSYWEYTIIPEFYVLFPSGSCSALLTRISGGTQGTYDYTGLYNTCYRNESTLTITARFMLTSLNYPEASTTMSIVV